MEEEKRSCAGLDLVSNILITSIQTLIYFDHAQTTRVFLQDVHGFIVRSAVPMSSLLSRTR
jgi:hypothetical protein